MNRTARKRPLNDAFKLSQSLPELPDAASEDSRCRSTKSAKLVANTAKPLLKTDEPETSIRRSFTHSLALDAAFCLLIAVCLLLPDSREGLITPPLAPPTTAAWANPWHRGHRPWNAFPTHHLPVQPTDHSTNI